MYPLSSADKAHDRRKDRKKMTRIARFVETTRELFYYISGLTMLCRHCESLEDAQRMVACSGVEQQLVRI
jgi:hypothetical protein